jgi:hypothetical protein
VKSRQSLKTNEITALAFVMANREWSDDGVSTSTIRADIERAGFTLLAAGLALTSLERQGFQLGAGAQRQLQRRTLDRLQTHK